MPWSSQLLGVSDRANVSGMTDDAASNPTWTPRPDGPTASFRTSEDHEHTLGDIRPLSRGNVD
jgi:hypothetical protein